VLLRRVKASPNPLRVARWPIERISDSLPAIRRLPSASCHEGHRGSPPQTEEIHGRCHHPITSGTEGFAGAKGLINFKDDVVNLKYDYRGHVELE
jgi:hypothetical protein